MRIFYKVVSLYSLLLLLSWQVTNAQKVGIVLSGGGAMGMAHIGFLKALEQQHIPIDYIAGTSMGALVGAMYAAGYSPSEIETYIGTDEFQNASKGLLENKYIYYFKRKNENASGVDILISTDSFLQTTLPSSLINSIPMDFAVLEHLSAAQTLAKSNFDSLFIPFRCVAADIKEKHSYVFSKTNLGEAVRASIAFPLYYAPVIKDDKLLFDGGLYNNFPIDVMERDFKPDVIIGCNASGEINEAKEDNFLSQIRTMICTPTNYCIEEGKGVMVNPEINNFSLFDFSKHREIINEGYKATMREMVHIKSLIPNRTDSVSLAARRKAFKEAQAPILVGDITILGLNSNQANYVKRLINPSGKPMSLAELKMNYFRLSADDNIKKVFPTLEFNTLTHKYDLTLDIRRQKKIITQFGGNFSNRPISEAFIGAQCNFWGKQSLTINANTYFGKLYNSGQVKLRLDIPTNPNLYIESDITINQWDFYRSSNAFIEDKRPSYLVQSDRNWGLNLGVPIGRRGKLVLGGAYVVLKDEYYQSTDFTQQDTADVTFFRGGTAFLSAERNTLNRKLYATEGTYLAASARYVSGDEQAIPGSTSLNKTVFNKYHNWYQFKGTYQNFYKHRGNLRLGFLMEGVFNTKPYFNNYSASALSSPAFYPLSDSKTFFIETFRAHIYIALGTINVITLRYNLDFRLEGYVFQPQQEILKGDNLLSSSGRPFDRRYFIGSANLVYNSPIGPISLSANYYEGLPNPVSVLFHFGYILFNKRALD